VAAILREVGRHKTAKSCLYIKRLADIDSNVLEDLISQSVRRMKTHGGGCG